MLIIISGTSRGDQIGPGIVRQSPALVIGAGLYTTAKKCRFRTNETTTTPTRRGEREGLMSTCPAQHPTAACQRYGSAYVHTMIRALWAIWLRKWEGR